MRARNIFRITRKDSEVGGQLVTVLKRFFLLGETEIEIRTHARMRKTHRKRVAREYLNLTRNGGTWMPQKPEGDEEDE